GAGATRAIACPYRAGARATPCRATRYTGRHSAPGTTPMPFAAIRDVTLCYEVRGSGPRLLIITGTGRDLRHRPSVFETPAATHFELLSYDQRGLGQSAKPDRPYT